MSKLLRTVSFASASFRTLVLAIVFVLCCASDAFAQGPNLYLQCPADGDVNCLGDVPSISAAEAGFDAVDVVESTSIISGNDCDYTIARTWTVTFANADTSIVFAFAPAATVLLSA